MTNRKNIKVSEETFERLKEEKGKYDTWDGFLNGLIDVVDCDD